MKVFGNFLTVIVITVVAGVLAYAAAKANFSSESILVITVVAVLAQVFISKRFSKQLDEDRQEALKLVARVRKGQNQIPADRSFKDSMQELDELFRETLRRERKVVENAADVICLVSTDGIILSANAAAKSVFGYTAEELVGKRLSDYQVAEEGDASLNPLLGSNESIQKISIENKFRRKDGTVIDVLWSAHWSATDNGLFCVAHDITERKLAERLVKESEERVQLILQSLPAGVCVLGLGGQIQFINEPAAQLFGLNEQRWDRHAKTYFKPCPEPFFIEQFVADMDAAKEPIVMTTSAEELPVEIAVRTMYWEEHPACLVMFVDVSEKRAAEKARQEFLAMRDESMALRQNLMDMVAHDIRTPLGALLSTHELILKGIGMSVEDKVKRKLELCQEDIKRIIRLINDLLQISRHEATVVDLKLAPTNIEDLITKAVTSVRDLAQEKSVMVTSNAVSATVNVDSDQMLRVLFNLLSNAIKFSPKDKAITVSSMIEPGCVKVSVSDEGKGIPAGSETSIFLPFSQISWKDSAQKGGAGLGLSICREIVEHHGGQIGVYNNETGGANFWFTLPVK